MGWRCHVTAGAPPISAPATDALWLIPFTAHLRSMGSVVNESGSVKPSFSAGVPQGDDKERLICNTCSFVRYENPLLVCGVLATVEDKILLVKRDIEPRKGFWTIPGGYMECGESTEAGESMHVNRNQTNCLPAHTFTCNRSGCS